jgi:hypothetical protein
MGMMRHIVNVGRKFRTAAMKKVSPKTYGQKPRAIKKEYQEAADWETEGLPKEAYVKVKTPRTPRTQKRITFKGQDMTEKNFHKSFKMVGSYKYGTIVSKAAMRTSPNVRLSGGGTGAKKALLDAYGSKGFKNYKSRSYTR